MKFDFFILGAITFKQLLLGGSEHKLHINLYASCHLPGRVKSFTPSIVTQLNLCMPNLCQSQQAVCNFARSHLPYSHSYPPYQLHAFSSNPMLSLPILTLRGIQPFFPLKPLQPILLHSICPQLPTTTIFISKPWPLRHNTEQSPSKASDTHLAHF